MAVMVLRVLLLIYVSGIFGHMFRKQLDYGNPIMQLQDPVLTNPTETHKDLDPHNPHQQWQDLVMFVNRKIEGMDQLLTEKDERIDRMESNIAGQTTEIKQLKQGITSLGEDLSQKDVIVKKLEKRISHLEKVMIATNLKNEHEPEQLGISDFLQRGNDTGLAMDRESSNYRNDSIMLGQNKQHIDKEDDPPLTKPLENTAAHNENESSHLSRRKVSRFQQQGSTAPSARQTIAFHVVLSRDNFVSNDDVVVYDNETLDIGFGYNPRDGVYVIPEAGTYVFTWTSICYGQEELQTVLVVNSAVRGSSWTDSELTKDIHQTTAVVVLTLKQGDHVFIRMGPLYGHGVLLSRTDIGVSTFSGWKLG